jgi:hypothetical protein
MDEMYKILIRNDITPNQLYLLWGIREKVTTPGINTNLELRNLKKKNLILENGSLHVDAKRILKEVEAFFKIRKKKTNTSLMGDDFSANMEKYNNAFPNMKLPTGKRARSAKGNLESAFRWFFQNYEYSWETIHKATAQYLDDRESQNWNYTRNSQYFIRKQQTDKTWDSWLADYCMDIEEGNDSDRGHHFKEKVY